MTESQDPLDPKKRRSLSAQLKESRDEPGRIRPEGPKTDEPKGAKVEIVVKQAQEPSTKGVSAGAAVPAPKPLSQRMEPKMPSASETKKPTPESPLAASDHEARSLLREIEHKPGKDRATKKLLVARELTKEAKEDKKRLKRDQKLQKDFQRHSEYAKKVSERLGLDPNRPITAIPGLPGASYSQVEFTTVQDKRAFIRISFDQGSNRYTYEVIEPQLTANEAELLELIRDTMIRTLDGRYSLAEEDAETYLLRNMDQAILDHSILVDDVSKARIQYYIIRDFIGYGPIDVLMRDPMIEDISCDGPGIGLYLFHRNYESIKTNVIFTDELALDSFVIRLAQRSGKQISIADPLLDATLPDKSRLQASLSKEVTTRGSSFTIRKFRSDPLTPTDLCRLGTFSPEMGAFFWFVMEEGVSMIYAGGTASGKTSTLNAISTFIPPQKKIVSIEDTREINLPHENWIAGLTRTGFGGEVVAGKVTGTIDMYKLLEAALRQRPEYLLVGEVRGPEAQTLFQAMATGHATYSTLHGDSVQSAVYRLENPPISVPRIMLQTLGAIAIQIQARVNYRLVRRVKEVVEIVGIDPETKDLLTNAVFEWDNTTDTFRYLGKSVILERVMAKRNWGPDKIETEWNNRTTILSWMIEKGIRRIDDVVNVISAYYSNPDALMTRIRDQMGPKVAVADVGGAKRGA